jgi:hypothetical protein
MKTIDVDFRKDRNGRNSQFATSTNDADSYLASIGYEDLFEHAVDIWSLAFGLRCYGESGFCLIDMKKPNDLKVKQLTKPEDQKPKTEDLNNN